MHELKGTPTAAAGCLARNFENFKPGFSAAVRPLNEQAALELIARWTPDYIAAIAHIEPSDAGSRAVVWLRRYWFMDRDKIVPAMVAGC